MAFVLNLVQITLGCDWGTVAEIIEGKLIALKWQISPTRSPEPNPAKASDVKIIFSSISDFETNVDLTHEHFENHGGNYIEYLQAMNSEKGWDYILNRYVNYCTK